MDPMIYDDLKNDNINQKDISYSSFPQSSLLSPSKPSTKPSCINNIICDVCGQGNEGENDIQIIICSNCGCQVHPSCYGLSQPNINWVCQPCLVSEKPKCTFCRRTGGAFKQTDKREWCHLLCSLYIPETFVGSNETMEPIYGSENIDKNRYHLKCSVCHHASGVCLQCSASFCRANFHPMCAKLANYRMEAIEIQNPNDFQQRDVLFTIFCPKHRNTSYNVKRHFKLVSYTSLSSQSAISLPSPSPPLRVKSHHEPPQTSSDSQKNNTRASIDKNLIQNQMSNPISFWKKINEYYKPLSTLWINSISYFKDLPPRSHNDISYLIPPLGMSNIYRESLEKYDEKTLPPAKYEDLDNILPHFYDNPYFSKCLDISAQPFDDTIRKSKHKFGCCCSACYQKSKKQSASSPHSVLVNYNHQLLARYIYHSSSNTHLPILHLSSMIPLSSPRQYDNDEVLASLLSLQDQLSQITQVNSSHFKELLTHIQPINLQVNQQLIDSRDQVIIDNYFFFTRWSNIRYSLLRGTKDIHFGHNCHDDALEGAVVSVSTTVNASGELPMEDEEEDEEEQRASCSVCFDGDSSENNPIVFCERCNISVHKYCYGISIIPEGDWFCDYCKVHAPNRGRKSFTLIKKSEHNHRCMLCPIEVGAFKKVDKIEGWAHIACAFWVPSVFIADIVKMEPIMGVLEEIRRQRKMNISCSICDETYGCCIKCSSPVCDVVFHPLCAWYHGNYLQVVNVNEQLDNIVEDIFKKASYQNHLDDLRFECYCENHLPQSLSLSHRTGRIMLQQRHYRKKVFGGLSHRHRRGKTSSGRHLTKGHDEDIYQSGRCVVCFEEYEDHDNHLLRCNHCGIDVHQSCYGVVEYSTHRKWVCRRCENKNAKHINCVLCPRKGGAFKPTTDGRWAHVVCAFWGTDTSFVDTVLMEPIKGVSKALKYSHLHTCYLCNQNNGICIPCVDRCSLFFHPLCGLFSGAFMKVMENKDHQINLIAYCRLHTPITKARGLHIPDDYRKMLKLRRDMDRVRTLIDLCRKREKQKKAIFQTEMEIFAENKKIIIERYEIRKKELEEKTLIKEKTKIKPQLNNSDTILPIIETEKEKRTWKPTTTLLESYGQLGLDQNTKSRPSHTPYHPPTTSPSTVLNDQSSLSTQESERYPRRLRSHYYPSLTPLSFQYHRHTQPTVSSPKLSSYHSPISPLPSSLPVPPPSHSVDSMKIYLKKKVFRSSRAHYYIIPSLSVSSNTSIKPTPFKKAKTEKEKSKTSKCHQIDPELTETDSDDIPLVMIKKEKNPKLKKSKENKQLKRKKDEVDLIKIQVKNKKDKKEENVIEKDTSNKFQKKTKKAKIENPQVQKKITSFLKTKFPLEDKMDQSPHSLSKSKSPLSKEEIETKTKSFDQKEKNHSESLLKSSEKINLTPKTLQNPKISKSIKNETTSKNKKLISETLALSSTYQINDNVYHKYIDGHAYGAKILSFREGPNHDIEYFIHYTNWNHRYDRWTSKKDIVGKVGKK